MRLQKILLIGLLLFFGKALSAQKLLLSEREEFDIRNDDFAVVGTYQGLTAVYRNHASSAELIFYDKNFIKSKLTTLSFLPKDFKNIHFLCNQNAIVVFYEVKERKMNTLYASKLNADNTWSEPTLLDNCPSVNYRDESNYVFATSDNQAYAMLYTSFDDNANIGLHALVVNTSLSKVTQIEQSFSPVDFSILDVAAISNSGNLYIATSDKKSSKGVVTKLNVLSASKGAPIFSSIEFPLNRFAVLDVHIAIDNLNKNVYFCGYFAEGKYSSPKGIYFSVFDEGNQVVSVSHFSPITLQFSTLKSDIRDLKIKTIFLKKTGEVELVAEKTYQSVRTVSSPTSVVMGSGLMTMPEINRTVHEYNYDEIAIFNLKLDGSLAWNQTILKEQQSSDDGGMFSSFGVLQYKLGKAFLFSDISRKQTRLMASYVSTSGVLTMKELQTTEDLDPWNIMPRSSKQLSNTEIVMPCVTKSYLCFLKISY